ncbi:MAG: class I SAM-dependent methyltransferase [Chloroflexi bacterium]|nr:class I SAM-dependent methyltransferase [Chloroflexota bacterium]
MNQYKYSANYDDHLLAELYDLSETYTDDVDLLRKLINGFGPLKILECFSGTGRILMPLAQDGHAITGIELAQTMQARAVLKLSSLEEEIRQRVELKTQDVLDGDWGIGYDLIVIGANSFYELPSANAQEKCIRFAWEALKPGGFIYVDNNDYKSDWANGPFGRGQVIFEGTGANGMFGRFTMRPISFDRLNEILEIERTWFKRTPDGIETEVKYSGKKRPVRAMEVKDWLTKHGFVILDLFGDRKGKPYTPESNRAIFWAKKKEGFPHR